MKSIHFCFLAFLTFSCQEKKTQSTAHKAITYSLDTIGINSKGEILDVEQNLLYSGITADQRFLYNFNHFDHHLEKIDLNNLELVEKIPFEKDGPNAIEVRPTSFQFFNGDKLLISGDFRSAKTVDLNGNVLLNINLTAPTWDGDILQADEICRQKLIINQETTKLMSLITEEGMHANNKAEIALFDLTQNHITRFNIDPKKKFNAYCLTAEDNSFLPPRIYFAIENHLPVLTHELTNEIYWYDSASNQFQEADYESRLTPDEANTELPHKFETAEELFEVFEKMYGQIRFGRLVFDRSNGLYYRLSFQTEFKPISERESPFPEVKSTKVYLTIFDQHFNLINEALIPEFDRPITHYFSKDGKLWILDNELDQMTFVRLNFPS